LASGFFLRAAALAAIAAAGACGNAQRSGAGETAKTEKPCAGATGDGIVVTDAWVRPATAGQAATALYASICNAGDAPDRLISASADLADAVELHETTRDAAGVARMSRIDAMDVAPGKSVALAPGGAHVMLIGLKGPVDEGGTAEVTLVFEKAGPVVVRAAIARDGGEHQHH
jgi:copper(I)-binding protein